MQVSTTSPVAEKASFERIRYAQAWEDGDLLIEAMGDVAGQTLLTVGASGDNALALLLLDPARVVAADLSQAQLDCLGLRRAAIARLEHGEFLELMGARPSQPGRRTALLDRVLEGAEPRLAAFWRGEAEAIEAHGAGGIGKFEGYFRLFRRYVLPFTHSRRTLERLFEPKDRAARVAFFERKFNGWRWRLAMTAFFSRPVMGKLGRDKAFFDHVEGSVGAHVGRKLRHALTDLEPAENPYLHWIVTGTCGAALPVTWRAENYALLKSRLDRIEPHLGPLESAPVEGVGGFYLSDIFEYMSPDEAADAFARFAAMAQPGARLVYWNMMAPRHGAEARPGLLRALPEVSEPLKGQDKAFFYSDFVVDEVL